MKPVLALFLCLISVFSASGQTGQLSPEDTRALRSFRLSMDTIGKLGASIDEMAAKHDPGILTEFRSQESLNGVLGTAQKMEKTMPRFTAILRNHGLTPRDYLMTVFMLSQAGLVAAAQKHGQKVALPPYLAPENVTFVSTHEGEIRTFVQKWSSEVQKLQPAGRQ